MSRLELRLPGPPEPHLNGQKLALPTRKLWATVVYLAAQGHPVEQGKLAGLLWDQADEERARGNLRQGLYRMRGSPAEALLVVKVPAGTFQAFKVVLTQKGEFGAKGTGQPINYRYRITQWYARGVGLVRRIWFTS